MTGNLARSTRLALDIAPAVRQGRNVIATIGIDTYLHLPKLKNAAKDADGVAALFRDRLGFEELAPPLRNEEATADAISALVQDQLQSALQPDDSLVLFFAGHGYLETTAVGKGKVQTGYLIPVEGRRPEDRKLSTYLKLISFLEDVAKLPARHVLVILDACYSGFALGRAVHRTRGGYSGAAEDLNRRLSRRVITSAMADETALDGGPKDGHSVFTGTLIEALGDNQADRNKKGWVTSSELALFLQTAVPDWTDAQNLPKQTPDFGVFELDDRGEMIISLRGEVILREQEADALRAGDALYELGWLTGEPKRFASARREYREARRLARLRNQNSPLADLAEGRALFAAGDAAEAAKVLAELLARDSAKAPAQALFYLGMAQARLGDRSQATTTLRAWLAREPDHPDAAWVRAYLAWLRRPPVGQRKALLIGINHYLLQINRTLTLQGAVNDVELLMKPALIQYFGLRAEDVDLLRDEQATAEGCRAAFARLREHTTPADAVIVHYSGHSVPSANPDVFGKNDVEHVYLVLHDTNNAPGYLTGGMTADELHRLMQEIPAGRKTLILDTHPTERIVELAGREDATYALALASDTAEQTYELNLELDSQKIRCGLFTYALFQALAHAQSPVLTYADWFRPAFDLTEKRSEQQYRHRQTPLFEGLWHLHLFGGDDPFQAAQEFVQRRTWADLTIDQLVKQVGFLRTATDTPHPKLEIAYARGLRAKSDYGRIIQLIEPQAEEADAEQLMTLACAQFAEGKDANARTTLDRFRTRASPDQAQALAEVIQEYETPQAASKAALLVAIGRYSSPIIRPWLFGAENDVQALKAVLVDRWGFQPQDVTVLQNEAATREAIVTAFKRLVEAAHESPALFYFAGHGSQDPSGLPTIVPTDSGQDGVRDIALEELAKLVGDSSTNLWTVFDASHYAAARELDMRVQAPDPTAAAPNRAEAIDDAAWNARAGALRVGAVCVLAQPPGERVDGQHKVAGPPVAELDKTWGDPPQTGLRSPLSFALVELLATASPEATVADLVKKLRRLRSVKPAVRCQAETQRLLGRSPAGLATMLADRIDGLETRRVVATLDELIDARAREEDLWPEGRLAAGIALAAVRSYPEARQRLEEAVGVFSGKGLPRPDLAAYA